MPFHLKQNTNHTSNKWPNVPSHHHLFLLNFDKANHSFLNPFLLSGKTYFRKKCCPGEWVILLCLRYADKNFRKVWVKMSTFNSFSRNGNVNTINLKKKNHQCWNKQVWEKIQHAVQNSTFNSGERKCPKEFTKIWKDLSLRLLFKDKGGNQYCLRFFSF